MRNIIYGALFVIACGFLATTVEAQNSKRLICVGDSISHPWYSWCNRIRDLRDGYVAVNNVSQAGLTLMESVHPVFWDLPKVPEDSVVAIFLGSNDRAKVNVDLFINKYKKVVRHYEDQGHQVLVMNIPRSGYGYRVAIRDMAKEEGYNYVDPGNIWPSVETRDTVHPTPDGHWTLAEYVYPFITELWDKDREDDRGI